MSQAFKHPSFVSNVLHENDQRLKAWPRPERFRGCVAASLRSA